MSSLGERSLAKPAQLHVSDPTLNYTGIRVYIYARMHVRMYTCGCIHRHTNIHTQTQCNGVNTAVLAYSICKVPVVLGYFSCSVS